MLTLEKKCCARKSFARFLILDLSYKRTRTSFSLSLSLLLSVCVVASLLVFFACFFWEFFFCICQIVDSCSVFNSFFAATKRVWKNIRHTQTLCGMCWCCVCFSSHYSYAVVYTTTVRCVSAFLFFHLSHHQQTKKKTFTCHIYMRSKRMRTHIFMSHAIFTLTEQNFHAIFEATRKK